MSLKKRIIHNTIVSVASRVVGVVIGVAIIGLNTRYLGQNGFGDFSTVLAFLFVFSVLADLGLYSLLIKEISRAENDEKKIANNILAMRVFSALFIFSLSVAIGFIFPYSQQIKLGILVASLGYWSMSVNQILMSIFQKYLRMDKVALAEGLGRFLQLGLTYYFIHRDWGFFSMVWAFSLASLANLIILFIFARRYIPLKLEFDFSFWKQTIARSYPLAIGAVLIMLYFKLDTVLLSLMKSSADVAIYSLPYRILEILIFFPSMFTGLIMPIMSRNVGELGKLKNIIQKSFDLLLIMAIPMVAGTLILSQKIILFLSSREFIKSAEVLDLLIFGVAIIFISNLLYNIIVILERQKDFIWIFGIGALVNITSNLIFIPKYSYYATSLNTVITEFLVAVLMAVVIYKHLKYLPSLRLAFKVLLASLLMSLFIYFFNFWSIVLTASVGILIYFVSLYLLRGISKEDVLAIWQK